MLYFLGAVIISFLVGALSVIVAGVYFLYKYKDELFQLEKKPHISYEKNQLGNLLHYNLHSTRQSSILGEKETCRFVNILFAYIFREWRDTNQLQKWVLKKINIEFMEFMETKTASRLLQGIKVHDVSLGTNFPVFHGVKIKEPFAFNGDEMPDTVVLEVDMEYHGGFFLAIDVDLVFGKNAFLSVRIAYLRGRIRLHFGRQPCTYWSICFLEEPEIKFDVETSFETRQLPQLTSLIVNQIRRTIRRKHTFPHFKMRYNPFFSFQHPEVSPFEGFVAEIPIQPAILEVSVSAATRLLFSSKSEKERNSESPCCVIYATISVNRESCKGKVLLNRVSTPPASMKPESFELLLPDQEKEVPTSSKSQSNKFNSLQRSFMRKRKPAKSDNKTGPSPSKKEDHRQTDEVNQLDATSTPTGSSTYVMVAVNFSTTLMEETKKNGQKMVVVENITEYNDKPQSGMKNGDTVVELNGTAITSLSQAIATIEQVRSTKQAFKFKVKRNKSDLTSQNVDHDSDRSSGSQDTESDHSDIESDDYKDFVNISLQVEEFHTNAVKRRAVSTGNFGDTLNSTSLVGSDKNEDVPYMTLGSSSQSDMTQNGKDDSHGRPSNRSRGSFNKLETQRSRSESPPIFRKAVKSRQSSPRKYAQTVDKGKKKELPKKERNQGHGFLGNLLSDKEEQSSKQKSSSDSPSSIEEQVNNIKPDNLSFARVDDEPDSQIYKTSLENSNQREYSWDSEKFVFNLKEKHRYLNVRFWSQHVNKMGIVKGKYPQIIGCVSIPLCELELYCRAVSSRRVTRRFPLSAPHELPQDHKWFLNDSVSNKSSFREKYCYGDTTLTVKLKQQSHNQNNSSNYLLDSSGILPPDDQTDVLLSKEILKTLSHKTGTDLQISSGDGGPKIVASRHTQTLIEKSLTPPNMPVEKSIKTEANGSSIDIEVKEEVEKEKVSLSQKLMGFLHSSNKSSQVKKSVLSDDSGSTIDDSYSDKGKQDDVIVGVVTHRKTGLHQFEPVKFEKSTKCTYCNNKVWMKSGLQCTACHAVCHKRCIDKYKIEHACPGSCSHSNCPNQSEKSQSVETDAEDTTFSTSDSDGTHNRVLTFRDKILDFASSSRNDTQGNQSDDVPTVKLNFLSKNADDMLAINAKEMGKDLHRDLPLSERKKMLESQIQKVENELNSEIAEKERLLKDQKSLPPQSIACQRIWKKIAKSDDRLQALALLLLHYRAGMEDCEFETTEEGMILSDDEDEKYGPVGSKRSLEVNSKPTDDSKV